MICIQKDKPSKSNNRKKRWLSPTSINSYLRCPRNFFYSNIEKRKQIPNIYLVRGIAVHNAIEKFYKFKLHRCTSMDYGELKKMVVDLLKDEWLSQKKRILGLKLKRDDLEFYYQESRKMILNFLHHFLKSGGFDKPTPIIEKTLFSRKHMLLGRIDAIYRNRGPPVLVDFKTSKSKKMTEDYRRQLGIYALLFKEHFREHPVVGIHFLNFKDGLMNFKVSDQRLLDTETLVREIHQKTQSTDIKDYPCTCGWCQKNFKMPTT